MKNVYEIFEEFEQRTKKSDKIAVLQFNASYALKNILKGTFDPNVQFVFNEPVEYKKSDAPPGLGYSSIHQELGRAYLFEVGNPKVAPTLTIERKKQLLIQILESLESRESEIFMNMLLKKQNVKGLNASIVKEAFPDLL